MITSFKWRDIPGISTCDSAVFPNNLRNLPPTLWSALRKPFGTSSIKIENAHRTGGGKRIQDKPRHILVKFLYRPERHAVLMSAKKSLPDTSIYIMQDLPLADQKKKHALRDVMKRAYDNHQRPTFRNGKLFINDKEYHGS